jgi:hypothetical protein
MTVIMTDEEIGAIAAKLCEAGFNGNEISFQQRANRDRVALVMMHLGARVRKSSTRNQSIDPRYTVEGRNLPDLGMGNDRIFTNLYHLVRTL